MSNDETAPDAKTEFMIGALSRAAFIALVGLVADELHRNKHSDAAPLLALAKSELAGFLPLAEGKGQR